MLQTGVRSSSLDDVGRDWKKALVPVFLVLAALVNGFDQVRSLVRHQETVFPVFCLVVWAIILCSQVWVLRKQYGSRASAGTHSAGA